MGVIFSIFSRSKSRVALEQELSQLDKQITLLEEQESVLQNSRRKWLYMLVLLSFVRAIFIIYHSGRFVIDFSLRSETPPASNVDRLQTVDIVACRVRHVLRQSRSFADGRNRGQAAVLLADRWRRFSVLALQTCCCYVRADNIPFSVVIVLS